MEDQTDQKPTPEATEKEENRTQPSPTLKERWEALKIGWQRFIEKMMPIIHRIGTFLKARGKNLVSGVRVLGRGLGQAGRVAGKVLYALFVIPRSQLVFWTLKESVDLKKAKRGDIHVYWQPLVWVGAKVLVIGGLTLWLFQFHTFLANWLEQGLIFFRLHEIYNFELPGRDFFRKIAAGIFIFVLGYHGLYFLIKQIQALFSNLVVDEKNRLIYYINSLFLTQEIHVIPLSDIDSYVIRQNLLTRLFRMGTVVIQKHRDEEITISTLFNASGAMKRISRLQEGWVSLPEDEPLPAKE